jgi:hypothetical protein
MRDMLESTMHVKEQNITGLQKKLIERFWAKEFRPRKLINEAKAPLWILLKGNDIQGVYTAEELAKNERIRKAKAENIAEDQLRVVKASLIESINESEEWDQEKSNLYQHALRELTLAGVEKDIYGKMLPDAILEIVKTFAKQGHSGMSAAYSLQLLDKLLRFENLTPITDNSEDWSDVSEMCDGTTMYQCKRNPALFSTDGGKTYYHVDERNKIMQAEHYERPIE